MKEAVITPEVDHALLDALQNCKEPVGVTALTEITWPRDETRDPAITFNWLRALEAAGFVRSFRCDIPERTWAITDKGRAHWAALEAKDVMREAAAHVPLKPKSAMPDPLQVTICEHADPEDREPAQALLCVDEDELDAWWANLDVEAKADAFVQWSLGNDGANSHVYIEPRPRTVRIPIVGTAGESAEEWAAKATKFNNDFKTQLRESLKATEAQS